MCGTPGGGWMDLIAAELVEMSRSIGSLAWSRRRRALSSSTALGYRGRSQRRSDSGRALSDETVRGSGSSVGDRGLALSNIV